MKKNLLPSIRKYKKWIMILLIILVGYLWYEMPFKATKATSPYFVESLFRLRDYASYEGVKELQDNVLPTLFPVGTPKAYVDKILSRYGGAIINDSTESVLGKFTYRFIPINMLLTPDSLRIEVYYDSNLKVEVIWFMGKRVVGDSNYKPQYIGR